MEAIAQLDAIVKQFDLNTHPFYQDWRMGTLPIEKLRSYGAEYGHFIATIADGWETIGERAIAEEERDHVRLWGAFKEAVGSENDLKNRQTMALLLAARSAFKSPATAAGALYAFEAQQPSTSASKLAGLNEHYSLGEAGKEYFAVHANDFAEPQLLAAYIEALSPELQLEAKEACESVCRAMWAALDGVYAG